MALGAAQQVAAAATQLDPSQHGRTLGEWAAEWWRWALEAPTPRNPLVDETGARCAVGQRGNVWFLAGSPGSAPITRTCTMPRETVLFFPIVNAFFGSLRGDPTQQKTETFCRSSVQPVLRPATTLTLRVDGMAQTNLGSLAERSALFEIQLPRDNIFGLADPDPAKRLVFPACDEGFYVFLRPLPPGTHTVRWTATTPSGISQDITYTLIVTS